MPTIQSKGSSLVTTLIAVVVVVVVALGLFYMYVQYETARIQNEQAANVDQILAAANSNVLSSNLGSAVEQAQIASNQAQKGTDVARARFIEATSRYLTGQSNERLNAVAILKDNYSMPNVSNLTKARIINQMLTYLSNSREEAMFDAVFTGEPFARYKVEGDKMASIKKLAEAGYAFNPTTVSAFQRGFYDAAHLLDFDQNYTVIDEQKQEHLKNILAAIADADKLFPKEQELYLKDPDSIRVRNAATYYYWRGLLFSAAALVDEKYLADAKQSFDGVINEYDVKRDQNGKQILFIGILVPYAQLGYANALAWVDAAKYKAEIKEQLSAIMREVNADPNLHQSGILALIANVEKGNTYTQAYTMDNFKRLSALSPEFKAFLQDYGLTIK